MGGLSPSPNLSPKPSLNYTPDVEYHLVKAEKGRYRAKDAQLWASVALQKCSPRVTNFTTYGHLTSSFRPPHSGTRTRLQNTSRFRR